MNISADTITALTKDQLLPINGTYPNIVFNTAAVSATQRAFLPFLISGTSKDIKRT